MKKQIKNPHKSHSVLWWTIVLVSALFGGFLFLVHIHVIEIEEKFLFHFSPRFFFLTLFLTIIMSYRRANLHHKDETLGPFLSSLLFGIITQFMFFVLAPIFELSIDISVMSLAKMAIFFVLPSLLAFLLLRRLFSGETIGGDTDNSWFDWAFYLNWMSMMTNVMTIVSFIGLFLNTDHALLGIRGTIWGVYNIIVNVINDYIHRNEESQIE